MDGFRHTYTTDVRFRDIDVFGHVNNAVILTYAEAARVDYFIQVVHDRQTARMQSLNVVLAETTVTFRKPIYFGERVIVGTRTVRLGGSSITMDVRINADDQEAALIRAVVVHYNHEARKSAPLPDDVRQRIASFEGIAA